MNIFLGDIAFFAGAITFGFGMFLIYFGKKENSVLLKTGGYIVTVIAIVGVLCTGFFGIKWFWTGHFHHSSCMHMSENMHMMNRGWMNSNMNSSSPMKEHNGNHHGHHPDN